MRFNKDMLNRNPYYSPKETNPYTDNILESIANLSKNDPSAYEALLQVGGGGLPITPEDRLYGMDLLNINAIQGMTPEEGWTLNKLFSPEFIDITKQNLGTIPELQGILPNSAQDFNSTDLQNWYQGQAYNMLKANPYSKKFSPTLEEMLNLGLNKLQY